MSVQTGSTQGSEAESSSIAPLPQGCHWHSSFRCACRRFAVVWESRTSRNTNRKFIKCSKQNGCKIWVWEDLLEDYVKIRVNEAVSKLQDAFTTTLLNADKKDIEIKELRTLCATMRRSHLKNIALASFLFFILGFIVAQKP